MTKLKQYLPPEPLPQPNGSIPPSVKMTVWIVERLGFPIFVTCALLWFGNNAIKELTTALQENTTALIEFRAATLAFQTTVAGDHAKMLETLNELRR